MAQYLDFDSFIDVDNTVVTPSPYRVRNILTLVEKIAVIKAYDQRPMYKKVARMFNCSWEQIKNIVTNRDAIMEFYEATKNKTKSEADIENSIKMMLHDAVSNKKDTSETNAMFLDDDIDIRQKKIKFLGECVYECMKRLQYHAKVPITEELIRHKALEFLDILHIPGFTPTKKWLNLWKATYNITLSNKKIAIYTEPQFSLDIKDIITFCTKAGVSSKILVTKLKKNDNKSAEYEAKRLRKLNFLQDALKEYSLRVKFHHKSMILNAASLLQVANEFNEILKVQDFEPTKEWIADFRKQFENEECFSSTKRPPLSLDLKDILSYCSRLQNKDKDNTVTLAPKETALQMRVLPKFHANITENGLKFQKNPIIYLDEESGAKDIKPVVKDINVDKSNLVQSPPLKIRKIESINSDPKLLIKLPALVPIRSLAKETAKDQKTSSSSSHPIIIKQVERIPYPPVKVNSSCVATTQDNVKIKEENIEDSDYILPTNPPKIRLQQIQIIKPPSPRPAKSIAETTSSSSLLSEDSEELPRHVTSFKDVQLLLKPLEEYAMLKENYRAIGLITQLEEVLKNQPEINNGEEEFIG